MPDPIPAVLYAAKSTADPRGSIPTQLEDCGAAVEREGGRTAFYTAQLDPEAWAVADFKVDRRGHPALPPRERLVDTGQLTF